MRGLSPEEPCSSAGFRVEPLFGAKKTMSVHQALQAAWRLGPVAPALPLCRSGPNSSSASTLHSQLLLAPSTVPSELKYSKEHEWVSAQEGDIVAVGITDHAQVRQAGRSSCGQFAFHVPWSEPSDSRAAAAGLSSRGQLPALLQAELGDLVHIELPEVGSTVTAGEEFGVVESVKVRAAGQAGGAGINGASLWLLGCSHAKRHACGSSAVAFLQRRPRVAGEAVGGRWEVHSCTAAAALHPRCRRLPATSLPP